MKENLMEVLSVLRQEETAAGSLCEVIEKPPEPLVKLKRKPKSTKKKQTDEYVLHLRSQTERERLISDGAASVLTREEPDPLRPFDFSFQNAEPLSDYIREYWQKKDNRKSLWQLTGLSDAEDHLEKFYVDSMSSFFKTKEKEKREFSQRLFRVSQLPGRFSTQVSIIN